MRRPPSSRARRPVTLAAIEARRGIAGPPRPKRRGRQTADELRETSDGSSRKRRSFARSRTSSVRGKRSSSPRKRLSRKSGRCSGKRPSSSHETPSRRPSPESDLRPRFQEIDKRQAELENAKRLAEAAEAIRRRPRTPARTGNGPRQGRAEVERLHRELDERRRQIDKDSADIKALAARDQADRPASKPSKRSCRPPRTTPRRAVA